jgi:predicted glycoside hydrolase/deacetylase ChbG (UPF0249 family)
MASMQGASMNDHDEGAKTLVVHHDDLAASHAANMAFVALFDLGVATSGSVMVPCAWFPEMAAIARRRPDLDIGVHLTLTSEFALMRWRPLTGIANNGLTDPDGFFWSDVAAARGAEPRAVEAELRLQIDTALAAGIDVTHLDAHMGTCWQPEFVDIYLRLGADYRLPIVLSRDVGAMAPAGMSYTAAFAALAARGNPDFQTFLVTPFGRKGKIEDAYRALLSRGVAGLNFAAFHFAEPSDIVLFSPDAAIRTEEYGFFASGRGRALIKEAGYSLAGMRGFRDDLRAC